VDLLLRGQDFKLGKLIKFMSHIPPAAYEGKFTCPHCGVIAQQNWWSVGLNQNQSPAYQNNPLRIGKCVNCSKYTIWLESKMLFPSTGTAPNPNSEMPPNVKGLYLEAASVQASSPRGAAALLRLAVQLLCKELGEAGKNIDDDIAALVKKGLPVIVQQSLDVVRVTGNHAVHPGQIDVDDPQIVTQLFNLLNIICEYMIALPKKVSGLYSSLPPKNIEAIKKRDK
jgi:hypothetical protein